MNEFGPTNGITVCIPTYKRPEMLRQCIESVFPNQFRPIEILVSDHDFGDASQRVVSAITTPDGILIRHFEGPLPRCLSANTRHLFEVTRTEKLILLHDDDLLTAGAIDLMNDAMESSGVRVDLVYGRQHLTDESLNIDEKATHQNDRYYVKDIAPGVQLAKRWSALSGQIPSDGFLIRRELCLRAGYPTEDEVGRLPLDYHFGIRCAEQSEGAFVLLDKYTSIYRLSQESLLRTRRREYNGHRGYEQLLAVETATEAEAQAKQRSLDRFAASAAMGYLAVGCPASARSVLRRHFLRLDKPWSVRIGLLGILLLESLGIRVVRYQQRRMLKA